MDRLSFDAPFSANLSALPVRQQSERVAAGALRALWRHALLILTAILLGFAIGVVALALLEKRFTAEAVVQLDFSTREIAPGLPEQSRGVMVEAGPMIQSEARIISSRPVARAVAERLGLADDPGFAADGGGLAALPGRLAAMAGRLLVAVGIEEPAGGSAAPEDPRSRRMARVVDELLQHVGVASDNRSYLVSIYYSSPDPALSARIANAFAEEYLRRERQAGTDAATRTSDWFDGRIRNTTAALRQAEAEIDAFRARTGLLEPGRPDSSADAENVEQQRLRTLATQLNAATLARMNEERRLARVQEFVRAGGLPSATDIQGLPLVALLMEREALARRELSEVASRYGPRHPDVRGAQAGLADIRSRLAGELARAVPIVEGDLAAARRTEEELQRRLDAQQAAMVAGKAHETELRNLQAQAQVLRDRLSQLTQSSELALSARERAASVASLVAPAEPPRNPAAPKPLVVLALSVLGGLSAGIGAALLLERRDRGLRTGEEVRQGLGLRCLGLVPEAPGPRAGPRERTAFDESIYAVCAGADLFAPAREGRVVLVTSSLTDEGRSTLCTEVARALADAGKRVLLIGSASAAAVPDAERFGAAPAGEPGQERSLPARLVVLERKRTFSRSADANGLAGFASLLDDARRHFDVIVLEGEPVMLVADSLVLGHLADEVIHVARWGATRQRVVAAALRRMQEHAIEPRGLVLTRVDLRRHAQLDAVDEVSFFDRERRFYDHLALQHRDGERGRRTAARSLPR